MARWIRLHESGNYFSNLFCDLFCLSPCSCLVCGSYKVVQVQQHSNAKTSFGDVIVAYAATALSSQISTKIF